MRMNVPARFPGSAAQREANQDSHRYWENGRCMDCDSRMGSVSAEWPCGASVPRVDVGEQAGMAAIARLAAVAWSFES